MYNEASRFDYTYELDYSSVYCMDYNKDPSIQGIKNSETH